MIDQLRLDAIQKQVQSELDLDAYWLSEYQSFLAEELVIGTRRDARRRAHEDIRQLFDAAKRISLEANIQ